MLQRELKVKVISASNLDNKDSGIFGDFSDPYVKLCLGPEPVWPEGAVCQSTSVKDNDLNPVWNETLSLSPEPEDQFLLVRVYNSNKGGIHMYKQDQELGFMFVLLDDIPSNRRISKRERLEKSTPGVAELELEIFWASGRTNSMQADEPSLQRNARSGRSRQKPSSLNFGGASNYESEGRSQRGYESEGLRSQEGPPRNSQRGGDFGRGGGGDFGNTFGSRRSMQQQQRGLSPTYEESVPRPPPTGTRMMELSHGGALTVRIISARKLKNTDTGVLGDVSDPYVRAMVGNEERKTKVIQDNLNPNWDETLEFLLRGDDPTLKLEVFNKNKFFKDDSLGKCRVDLTTLVPDEARRFSEYLDGGEGAELIFELTFVGEQTSSSYNYRAARYRPVRNAPIPAWSASQGVRSPTQSYKVNSGRGGIRESAPPPGMAPSSALVSQGWGTTRSSSPSVVPSWRSAPPDLYRSRDYYNPGPPVFEQSMAGIPHRRMVPMPESLAVGSSASFSAPPGGGTFGSMVEHRAPSPSSPQPSIYSSRVGTSASLSAPPGAYGLMDRPLPSSRLPTRSISPPAYPGSVSYPVSRAGGRRDLPGGHHGYGSLHAPPFRSPSYGYPLTDRPRYHPSVLVG
mmetsp:Transcript_45808/g.83980  ORF Transcript_45808/g.83980 Transcript_45808/m.83980 type:complete len:626 (-) Transcript_45808:49-1926(-)